jgi:hypothetical protein
MLAGTPSAKLEAKNAPANAIVPIGRRCADMVPASPSFGDRVHAKNDYKTIQIGQSPVGFGAFCGRRVRTPYSTLMLANWITFAYFAISSATNFLKFATDIGIGSTPRFNKRDLRFGSVTEAVVAALSFSTISSGAHIPVQIPLSRGFLVQHPIASEL